MEILKNKIKTGKENIKGPSMLPWSLLLSADIIVQDPLVLQLSSQLLDLLLLLVELLSVRIPFVVPQNFPSHIPQDLSRIIFKWFKICSRIALSNAS